MTNKPTTEQKRPHGGVRLSTLILIMIVLAVIVSVLLILLTYMSGSSFEAMRQVTEDYIICQQDAAEMEIASDFLTEQVRAFAATGDRSFVDAYFEEVNVTKRRETVLEDLSAYYYSDSDTYRYMEEAMDCSEALMDIEYYSMRLVIESRGYDPGEYPDEIREVALTPEDLALPGEEQAARASAMLYDEEYGSYKNNISSKVRACTDTSIASTRAKQVESSNRVRRLLNYQYALTGLLLVIVFVTALVTTFLIVRPLRDSVSRIRNHEPLSGTGSYEMRFLAETYNTIYAENMKNNEQLSFEATHDGLTGLYNRAVFERVRESGELDDIAMLLIDVDHFKTLNDTYGHGIGDQVLQRVAAVLSESFRSEDYVCRIGGDEFAVIMVHADSRLRELIAGKIVRAAERLREQEGDVPPVTLSIGVAFRDGEHPTEDIYNDADTALYAVKNRGRNGFEFFG